MPPIQDVATHANREIDKVFGSRSEVARLCRETDWSRTPLGPVERWPQSLRTMAGTVVSASFPKMLTWGPERIQIYNDGYRDMIGAKHPAALGQRVSECWAEIWTSIEPLFASVDSGETVVMENLPLQVIRYGAPETAYFTFSYSPVPDESGGIGGVLDVAFETTRQVEKRQAAAERERLYDQLELERSRLAFAFQWAPSFFAILRGPDHTVDRVNDAYYQLVGHREMVGKPLQEALPEVRGQGFMKLLDGVLRTGEPFLGREVPILLARTPGAPVEERFIDLTYIPMMEADGTRSGIIAHGMDVTDHVRARSEIERLLTQSEQARSEAEAANRTKTEFLSAMSHELRTPLNAIGGYAELLAMGIHGPINEGQRWALERVTAGQRHLLVLINDILSHTRLEAGHITFDLNALEIQRLLTGVEPLISPQAQAKGIALSVHRCECDPDVHVNADEERVRQILLNLAGNAIKFTDPGGWVVLSCDTADQWVYLSVHDNGRGIPEDQLERIFDPFQQVGRRLNDPQEGVGLGLAISRDLARGMSGDVAVESSPGKGSTFTLRLPRAAEE